jgi:hypothetical protein
MTAAPTFFASLCNDANLALNLAGMIRSVRIRKAGVVSELKSAQELKAQPCTTTQMN